MSTAADRYLPPPVGAEVNGAPGALASSPSALSAQRAGLAVVTFGPEGGGIAYVGRLLARAMSELYPALSISELRRGGGGRVRAAEALRFGARLAGLQATRRVDWIVFNHAGPARLQRRLPAFVRRPYAVFLHDVDAWDPSLPAERKAVLRGATLRIANSAFTAARATDVHSDLGPVHPCPLGLLPSDDAEGTLDAPTLSRIGPSAVVIVGRIASVDRYKGHDQLIEAWPSVLRSVPEAQLVVVGTGDDVERLRTKARHAGVGDKVLFTGFVSNATLSAILDRAALFAMPSRREGFGVVYVQAMRAGLPCIGSREDAASEVIIDGVTGLLVEQSERDELERAIVDLLSDPTRRRVMGEAGRRRYEAEYTLPRFRHRLGALLEAAFPAIRRADR